MNKKLATLVIIGILALGSTVGVYATTSNRAKAGSSNESITSNVEKSKEKDVELTSEITKTTITEEKAKQLALASIVGSQFNDIELENENGVILYGVEIKTDKTVYDVKVDANTGAIIKTENDNEEQENGAYNESNNQDNDNVENENQDEEGQED